jgi:hypothetical protein
MKMLDFNAIQQPEWAIKLKDDNATVVTLTTPTERLLERLVTVAGELKEIKDSGEERSIAKVFELIAELMNNNLDGLKFTSESLRDKYRMNFYDAIFFVRQYLVFINEISEAKN